MQINQLKIALLFFVLNISAIDSFGQDLLLQDTIRSCQVDSIYVEAQSGFSSYLWSTGDTTLGVWLYSDGIYSLSALDDTLMLFDTVHLFILPARILQNDTSLICGDTTLLKGTPGGFNYFWTPGDTLSDSIHIYPRGKTMYYALITDTSQSLNYCLDSVEVDVEPIVVVDSLIQSSMGCPGEKKARIKIEASGGYPPYVYDWPPQALPLPGDSSIANGLSDGTKHIIITDTIGCFVDHEFEVKAHPIPDLILSSDPADTVYLQNPYVVFNYENPQYDSLAVDTFYVTWWEWNFGDSSKSTALNPRYAYKQAGSMNVVLKFKTFYNCPGSDSITIDVKPVHFFTSQLITPNGDQSNDCFEVWYDESGGDGTTNPAFKAGSPDPIDPNKYYKSNTLIIFNRWGEKIFKTDNYQNNWEPDGLKDGTYFYVFKCVGEYRTDVYKGSFLILDGSGN